MKEFVICESCNASVEIHETTCDYCGSEFKFGKVNREILILKEHVDNLFFRARHYETIEIIEGSKYRNHPILLFRKAKALLVIYMTNDGILQGQEFCEVIKIMMNLSKVSDDYWKEFVLYITVLFPSSCSTLLVEDYKSIIAFLASFDLDREKIIEEKLFQQVVMSEAGETFVKEFKYFTNEKNHIDNKDFIIKRDYLKNKYSEIEIKIVNNIKNN